MKVLSKIGVAMALAGIALLIVSAGPYTDDIITTGCFLRRMAWAGILMGAGSSLIRG